jgi:hypothetical protein
MIIMVEKLSNTKKERKERKKRKQAKKEFIHYNMLNEDGEYHSVIAMNYAVHGSFSSGSGVFLIWDLHFLIVFIFHQLCGFLKNLKRRIRLLNT